MAATIQSRKNVTKGSDIEGVAPPALTMQGRKLSELADTVRPFLMDLHYPFFERYARQHVDKQACKRWLYTVECFSDSCERVLGILRGFVAILRHHRAREEVIQSFIVQGSTYLAVETEIEFVKRAKYLTCFPLARYNRNELPKCDTPFVSTGVFRRWCRPRLAKISRMNTHLWSSWFQAKRSALPLSTNMVLVNFMKHRDRMVARDPGTAELASDSLNLLWPVLEPLKQALDGLRDDRTRQVSTKSCQEFVRRCGGSQAGIAKALGFGIEWEDALGHQQFTFDDDASLTTRLGFYSDIYRIEEVLKMGPDGLVNLEVVRTRSDQLHVWENGNRLAEPFHDAAEQIGCLPTGPKPDLWYDALDRCRSKRRGRLRCKVKAVIEPFKIRTITAGECGPYHVSGDYQKAVHGCLRKMNCFRLIGRPCSPTDLLSIVDRMRRKRRDLVWISADYEASTDNLSRILSECLNDELTRELEFGDVFRACLDPHICEYPTFKLDLRRPTSAAFVVLVQKWIDEGDALGERRGEIEILNSSQVVVKIYDAEQVNAQLMGSRVSFVMLCLANLALYLRSRLLLAREEGDFKLRRRTIRRWLDEVLINGDDALFAGPVRLYEIFKEQAALFGLPLSVGKVYVNACYANINSTSFHMDLTKIDSLPVQIDYLNTGLLFGQSKVMGGDDEDGETTIVDTIDRCLSGSLPGRQVSLLADYLDVNRGAVNDACKGRNLFISKSLGGMGVRCPPGWRYSVTPSQIFEARKRSSHSGVMPAARPLFGHEVEKLTECRHTPWKSLDSAQSIVERLERIEGQRRFIEPDEQMRSWLEIGVLVGVRRTAPVPHVLGDPLGEVRNRSEYEDFEPIC